jgi:diacylglycerol kinase
MKKTIYKSFGYALQGFWVALKTERNLKIHLAAVIAAVGVGIYLGLPAVEWCLVVFAIGFVLTSELFNTAVEKYGDKVSGGKYDDFIKMSKDISAAAVLVAAVTALIIGTIILVIPFFQKMF